MTAIGMFMRPDDDYYHLILARFIGLTFLISWAIWALLPLLNSSNYYLNLWIAVLGLYGPSIAGMILAYRFHGTWWQHYMPNWKIFVPSFVLITTLGIGFMVRLSHEFLPYNNLLTVPVIILILLCSLLSAYLLSVMLRSPPGFETRNDKPMQVQSQMSMLLFALAFPLIIGSISFSIQQSISPTTTFTLLEILVITFRFPIFFISFSFLFSGATNEEIGWRGYMTPKLLQRYSPLTVGLIIGIFWSIWHLPLHISGFYSGGLDGFWLRLLWNTAMGVVFTWYYVKSGYNLLGAIILHGAYNMFANIGASFVVPAYLLTAAVMVVESKMWKSDYVTPENAETVPTDHDDNG